MYEKSVQGFLESAVECSYFEAPTAPGLTPDEICEAGSMVGLFEGELRDAIRGARLERQTRSFRLGLPRGTHGVLDDFHIAVEHDLRDTAAFEFVRTEMKQLVRRQGRNAAAVARGALVARGVAQRIDERALEAAVTILDLTEFISVDDDGTVRPDSKHDWPLPSEQMNLRTRLGVRIERPWMKQARQAVRDVISRRAGTLPTSRDAVRALEGELAGLGYPQFRVWWAQQVSELGLMTDSQTPTAVTVLCAALCEGALVFVVDRAQTLGLSLLSKSIERGKHSNWKFEDLAASAQRGEAPVFDASTFDRVRRLNMLRQRIHAGRLITNPDEMSYDARPEDAAFARETLQIVARRVVEWVRLHPAPST